MSPRRAFARVGLGLSAGSVLFAIGCTTTSSGQVRALGVDEKVAAARAAERGPDAANVFGVPLRTGQIVLTEATGSLSYVIVLIPEQFYPFTHAGIVSIEDGVPYVYDIHGRLATLPLASRVLDNVEGEMHRTPFLEYVAPNLYTEVHDLPPGVDPAKVVAFARQKFAEKVEFDAFFDYSDHKKLFCTELVELALEAGGAPPRTLAPTNKNPSVRLAMDWLEVPPDTVLPAGAFLDGAPFVGAFGQFGTRTAAYAYFEAKREFHRRFHGKDQRLGYAFLLKRTGDVDIRPEVESFFTRAPHLFDGEEKPPAPGDPRIASAVRALADSMFGPVAD